jgi:NTP pyrophosphatase (non-canonical NTP hydrolase)
MKNLEENVIEWAREKGILEKSSVAKQALKSVEEIGELSAAIQKGDGDEIKMELGDVIVTVILLAYFTRRALNWDDAEIWADNAGDAFAELSLAVNAYIVLKDDKHLTAFVCSAYSLALCYNLSLEECLESAYAKISKRSGSMIDGLFVKEAQ